MNILFTRFPLESAFGGAEIQTLSLMEGLRERGHTVHFLGSCPVLLQECANRGIECAQLNIGPPPVSKWYVISFLWRKLRMRKQLEFALRKCAQDIDAICMLSLSEKILLTPYCIRSNIPIFWIEHDRIGPWLTMNPWLPTLRKLSKHVTTIGVSEMSRMMYCALGWDLERTIGIPNGIDVERFTSRNEQAQHVILRRPERSEGHLEGGMLGVSKGGNGETKREQDFSVLHIGCIARLSKEKGVDRLIEAMQNMPEATVDIIGHGPEHSYCQQLIGAHQLSERVKIIEKHDDLGAFYASLDVLVLPSRDHDPFGLVAAEAMTVGVPVVVTDACGIADYLTHAKDAIIVRSDSSDALSDGLQQLQDSELRNCIAEQGKKLAHEQFTLKTMVDRYEQLLLSTHETNTQKQTMAQKDQRIRGSED